MASKVHLRQGRKGTTACATRGTRGDGTLVRNGRTTYQKMGAVAVDPEEFRATPEANRCAHCCERFTAVMNARRALSGKPPYADAMTKTLA